MAAHCLAWSGPYRLRVDGDAPEAIVLDAERAKPRGPEAVLAGLSV